jgi:SpoVK/Ycf46/Vps4 family AAA+-type ATPase
MPRIGRISPPVRSEALPASTDPLAPLRAVARDPTGAVLLGGTSRADQRLAAEALAGMLGRELVRVDLDAVAGRSIGETEKNLDRLFATAASGDAVLFFDEADALLSRRSDVKDSHDRYANIEVGHLLQKIEGHRGLVILASNLTQNIDPAFLRRLRHIVDLP